MPKSRCIYYSKYFVCESLLMNRKVQNVMQLPHPAAIICSASSHRLAEMCIVQAALQSICGQKPKLCPAKKSIAAFNLRKGTIVGCVLTLRRQGLYFLWDSLCTHLIPGRSLGQSHSDFYFPMGTLSFGLINFLEFPALEPFFAHFENVRGCNLELLLRGNQKRKKPMQSRKVVYQ